MASFLASPWGFIGVAIAVLVLVIVVLLIWIFVIDRRTKGMVDDMNADRLQVAALQAVVRRQAARPGQAAPIQQPRSPQRPPRSAAYPARPAQVAQPMPPVQQRSTRQPTEPNAGASSAQPQLRAEHQGSRFEDYPPREERERTRNSFNVRMTPTSSNAPAPSGYPSQSPQPLRQPQRDQRLQQPPQTQKPPQREQSQVQRSSQQAQPRRGRHAR